MQSNRIARHQSHRLICVNPDQPDEGRYAFVGGVLIVAGDTPLVRNKAAGLLIGELGFELSDATRLADGDPLVFLLRKSA